MELPEIKTILVVDDEASLRYFLTEELEEDGYQVYTAADGREGLNLLQQTPVDLVIVDFQMPGLNGLELMAAVQKLADVPELIMLTAHATLETSIEAMRRGSADFLLKPYDIDELLHSVKQAMARRRQKVQQKMAAQLLASSLGLSSKQTEQPGDKDQILVESSISLPAHPAKHQLEVYGLTVDMESMAVTKGGQPIPLTPTEFRLLAILMKRPNHPYTFKELAEVIYGQKVDSFQARDLLKSHIGRLRKKLGHTPNEGTYIINVRGVGYKFASDEAE